MLQGIDPSKFQKCTPVNKVELFKSNRLDCSEGFWVFPDMTKSVFAKIPSVGVGPPIVGPVTLVLSPDPVDAAKGQGYVAVNPLVGTGNPVAEWNGPIHYIQKTDPTKCFETFLRSMSGPDGVRWFKDQKNEFGRLPGQNASFEVPCNEHIMNLRLVEMDRKLDEFLKLNLSSIRPVRFDLNNYRIVSITMLNPDHMKLTFALTRDGTTGWPTDLKGQENIWVFKVT